MRDSKLAANPCFLIENCKGNNNATDIKDKRNKSRVFMRDVALYLPKFKEITNSINPCSREKNHLWRLRARQLRELAEIKYVWANEVHLILK